jgi:nucleotide-binding universal stress UspA family protein
VEYADRVDADLILMPTRGRGLLGQILFGSTTMDVLRITDRPVWAAKPEAIRSERPARCSRILCGVELGAKGESVLSYAAQWAAACAGELLIAHAVPEISEAMLALYGVDESGEIELLPEKARRGLAAMAAKIGVPCEVEAQVGDAAGILRTLAKHWSADVVIAGRGGGNNARRLGANIGDIIAQAPCPVIAYAERSCGGRPPRRRALGRVAAARRPGSLAAA